VLSWRELRNQTEGQLRALCVDAPDSEARWMIERVSGYDGVELVVSEAEPAPAAALAHVDDMVARRGRGEPLQYVLGEWQFLGLDLLLDRRVLVPRPETEVVAQVAIDEAARLGARRGPPEPWAMVDESFPAVDLGTGSGALALALVSALPDVLVGDQMLPP
jgi:release factor glutamine methyltransferase